MEDKYGVVEGYRNRLKNKLYSLLCAREEGTEWVEFLDALIIEIEGVPETCRSINYLTLYHKLNSLRYLDFKYFRKTIFDCMSLLSPRNGADGVL